FIGKVLVGHVAWVTAIPNMTDGIDQPERQKGFEGILSNLVGIDQVLGGNDDAFRRAPHLVIGDRDAIELAIAENVRPVDMDNSHVGIERWNGQKLLPREGTLDRFCSAVLHDVSSKNHASGQERKTHRSRLASPCKGCIGPFGHFDCAALHVSAGIERETPHFQPDYVGDIAAVETPAGCKDLKVMGGRVAGQTEILFALAHNFMEDCRGNPYPAETTGSKVITIMHEPAHSLGYTHQLVRHGARFLPEERPRLFNIGGTEEFPL